MNEEDCMSYFYSKNVDLSFEEAIVRVTDELKKEGFGVLTEIDVKATLKEETGCGLSQLPHSRSL